VLHAAPGAVIALYRSGTSGTPRIFKMMVILFKLLWMPQHPLESRMKHLEGGDQSELFLLQNLHVLIL